MSERKRRMKTSLTLPVLYSQDEMDVRRDRLSTVTLEYDKVEAEKKEASSVYNEQMKALRGEMRSISKAISRKGEDRPVDCLTTFHDPDVGFKTTIRMDTGEVVKTEPMTNDERQENLFEETQELERMFNTPTPDAAEPAKDGDEDTEAE